MSSKVVVAVRMELDAQKVWRSVFGSGFETCPWWTGAEFIEGDWDEVGKVEVSYADPDDYDPLWSRVSKVLDLNDIVKALASLDEVYAYVVRDLMDENLDAITSDVIIQQAVFGEVIYG